MTRKRGLLLVLLMLLVVGSFVAAAAYLFVPSRRVAWETCQPDTIDYQSFDPYCIGILEDRTVWEDECGTGRRRYQLAICREKNKFYYGCFIDVSFAFPRYKSDDVINASRVEWSPDGLTFVANSGYRLFVPKDAFIGGR